MGVLLACAYHLVTRRANVNDLLPCVHGNGGMKILGIYSVNETPDFLAWSAKVWGDDERGEFAAVHTPEMIAGYKTRGRPAGSVQAVTKRPTTLRLDEEALARWRASGKGWQTRAAAVLAKYAP